MSEMELHTTCCIVGGGPAGMMLGLLLARAGIDVIVVEKHKDFFRDFRGDTIHPSTLEIMHQLGLLEGLLQRSHEIAKQLKGFVNDDVITIADFSKLKVTCPYIAFMPQWDFLDFISESAKKYSNFRLLMQTEAIDLLQQSGKIVGIQATTPNGMQKITADLVVACDGRHSLMRSKANLTITDIGAPMDVFWFRLSRHDSDPNETFGKFIAGKIVIMIDRADYWQCGYVIPKGMAVEYQQKDIKIFRDQISETVKFLADRVSELKSWDDIKLLTVQIDRLNTWYKPGLLCIGDAAHAMSPVGGVGINLAIQDAVAAANILTRPLLKKNLKLEDLAMVQKRRLFPTKVIQKLQQLVQKRVISNVLANKPFKLPWLIKNLLSLSLIRRVTGYLIGIGVRSERINVSIG